MKEAKKNTLLTINCEYLYQPDYWVQDITIVKML